MTALEGELRHMRIGMMVYSIRTRSWLAECLAVLREFPEGAACAAAAARIAEATAHLGSAILVQHGLGRVALHHGDLQPTTGKPSP